MEVPILLEHLPANGFRATSLAPAGLSAEAPTRAEAIQEVERLVQQQFAQAELIHLHVAVLGETHPWRPLAGTWQDHPDAVEFEEQLREYRRQVDTDPERL